MIESVLIRCLDEISSQMHSLTL